MQDKRRFFSGATLDQAVSRAARHYGVDPKELAFREREKRHGFLHRRRGIVVEVNPAELTHHRAAGAPEGPAPATADETQSAGTVADSTVADAVAASTVAVEPAPVDERVDASDLASDAWSEPGPKDGEARANLAGDSSELFSAEWWEGEKSSAPAPPVAAPASAPLADGAPIEVAREGLARLLDLVGVSLESEIRKGDERLEIELSGNDQRVVLDRGGEVLLALEHLLPRVIRGLSGAGVPCRVDADGFHAAREMSLQELAERRAGEALRSRRRRTLPPMSPEERRIVHLTLADRGDVQTESRGEGFFKRVTIFPSRRG